MAGEIERQRRDQVGTAAGDEHADQPAEGVADQVHRPAGAVAGQVADPLEHLDDRAHVAADRVPGAPRRLRAAEPGQIDRPAVEAHREEGREVGPVGRRPAQPVHVQRALPRTVGAVRPAGPRRAAEEHLAAPDGHLLPRPRREQRGQRGQRRGAGPGGTRSSGRG